MKRLGILVILLSIFLSSCTGYMKDIRMGKTFAVIVFREVPIYKEPSLKSEVYYLKEPEAFVVEDVQFPEEYTFGDKTMFFLDPITSKSPAEYEDRVRKGKAYFADRFFKARFDSGEVGYIHFRYFYPELADSMISEELSAVGNETVREYAERYRKKFKEAHRKGREYAEKQKERALKQKEDLARDVRLAEAAREQSINLAPWPAKQKARVRDHKVWIGMTKDQLLFSQYPPKGIKKRVTAEGEFEDWAYKGTTYYFKGNKLIRWETTVADPSRHISKSPRDK